MSTVPTHIPSTIMSRQGRQFLTAVEGGSVTLTSLERSSNTIIVQGGATPTTVPLLAGIVDAIGDALLAVVKIMGRRMKTTTTVTCNDKGLVEKIETVTECD